MADTLDQLLEPGERVVREWRGGWLPDLWPNLVVIFLPLLALPVVWVLWQAPWQFLPIYAASLIPILAYEVIFGAVKARAAHSLLTDRRLLYRVGWRRPEITVLALAEVKEISWFAGPAHGTLKIVDSMGEALLIPLRRNNADLPAALAEAAKLPVPSLIGPARMAAASLIVSGGYLAGLGLSIAAAAVWLPWAEIRLMLAEFRTFDILWASLAITIIVILSFVLGGLLSLIFIRFVLNAAAARLWLGSKPHPDWLRPLPAFTLPAAFALARLLWGPAMNQSNAGAAGHG